MRIWRCCSIRSRLMRPLRSKGHLADQLDVLGERRAGGQGRVDQVLGDRPDLERRRQPVEPAVEVRGRGSTP